MFTAKRPWYFLGLLHVCYKLTHSATSTSHYNPAASGLAVHLLPLTSALLIEGYKQFGVYQKRLVFTPAQLS